MGSNPKEDRFTQLRRLWESYETEYLLEIWNKHDKQEWTEEVFTVIQEILLDRLGELPGDTHQVQAPGTSAVSHLTAEAILHLQRVEQYLEAGDLERAFSECELAIQSDPLSAVAYNYRGIIYNEMGQLENAIVAYQEAVRLDPEMVDASENLKSAVGDLERDTQLTPALQHLDQAVEFVTTNELERALQECDLAIQIMPHLAVAHNYRGMILEETEQLESAVGAYLEAVRLNPQFYAARENLSNARVKLEEDISPAYPGKSCTDRGRNRRPIG